MKKLLRYLVICSLAFALVLGNAVPALAAGTERVVRGNDIRCENLTMLNDGYYMVLESQTGWETASRSYPEKQKTVVFAHDIYDRNGSLVAIADVTVTGVYSEVEKTAVITSASVSYRNAQSTQLSYSTSYDGNRVTVYFTIGGATIGQQSYKLYTNGALLQD